MKSESKLKESARDALKTVLGLCLFCLALLFAAPAKAQITPRTQITVTNQPATVATLQTSNIVSWVPIYQGKGISAQWTFNQSGASTSNAAVNVYSSVDGTNISTVPLTTISAPSTGTTDVRVNAHWDANSLQGYHSLIFGNMANSTALTTLTNKGIIVFRDN
jgi:hypothetical protein